MTSSEPLTRLCVLTVNHVPFVLCSDWTALPPHEASYRTESGSGQGRV